MAIRWLAALLVSVASLARAGSDAGRNLFEKECMFCHSVGGQGGRLADKGGPLDTVGAKHEAAWLRTYLRDPKAALPDAAMPKMPLDDTQIDDLVSYMRTLKAPAHK